MPKKLWHDPVWSKVIAAGIIGLVGSYFLNWWPAVGRCAAAVFGWSGSTTRVWNWILVVLGMLLVLESVVLASLFLVFRRKADPARLYTSDTFYGVVWRWRYASTGQIMDLYCFCVRCGLQVFMLDPGGYAAAPQVAFRCDDCGHCVDPIEGPPELVESRVRRMVRRNAERLSVTAKTERLH